MDVQIMQFDERVGMGTFKHWLKELGCQIHCYRCDLYPPIEGNGPVLLLGGYMGVNDQAQYPYLSTVAAWITEEIKRGRPFLAICLGGQLLAHSLGGSVTSNSKQEKGIQNIMLTPEGQSDPLFKGLPQTFVSFEWHNDSFDIPAGATHIAYTETCPGQVFRYNNAWGLQFHPEVNVQIIENWCELTGSDKNHVEQFVLHQKTYFSHSRKLLENFVHTFE